VYVLIVESKSSFHGRVLEAMREIGRNYRIWKTSHTWMHLALPMPEEEKRNSILKVTT